MLVTAELLLRLTPEEREELRATLRREDLSPRVRERLEMVKAADLGHDLGQITAWSGRTPRTVRRRLGVGFEVWTSERLCSYLSRTSEGSGSNPNDKIQEWLLKSSSATTATVK